MKPLYEIDAEILATIDQETGEIIDLEKLDALQMERERKLEGVALWVKDLKAEAAAVKEEADKLKAREKSLNNKIDGLKNWLMYALNGEKLKTPRCNVYYTRNQRLAIANEEELIKILQETENPEDYLKFPPPELRKDEIKRLLKEGYKIHGATLEQTESVVIK